MPSQHGSKYYCQLLIDPNRYKLAEQMAERRGIKVTALLRDLIYEGLQNAYAAAVYNEAEAADAAEWAESIRRRVQGRARSQRSN